MSVEVIDILPATPARFSCAFDQQQHQHQNQQPWTDTISRTHSLSQSPEAAFLGPLSTDTSPCPATPNPDRASTSSSPTRSPEKHKRSVTTARLPRKAHVRRSLGPPKSPTVPTFHNKSSFKEIKSDQSSPTSEIVGLGLASPLIKALSHASTTEARSPAQKKPPASHSSYGVETSCGPPPSFTTQRTLSQDRLWKPTQPDQSDGAQKLPSGAIQTSVEVSLSRIDIASNNNEASSSSETLETPSIPTPKMEELVAPNGFVAEASAATYGLDLQENDKDDKDETIHVLDFVVADDAPTGFSSEHPKNEDLFLNIAKADPEWGDLVPRTGKRKSKITAPLDPIARSRRGESNESPPSPDPIEWNFDVPLPRAQAREQDIPPLSEPRPSAAAALPLGDASRHRHFRTVSRVTAPVTRSSLGSRDQVSYPEVPQTIPRRFSGADLGPRPYQHSNLSGIRRGRMASISYPIERHGYVDRNATDSTVSTTAPSTVWDELDDLKSRIRKLELTGKLPLSSAAAMSSVERPCTATTTDTTISSSPKFGKDTVSPTESPIASITPSVHPLLREALSKAKPIVGQAVYQKLEATASDALQLALMLDGESPAQSTSVERQARRKVDSMCRGLTELTIAISAELRPIPQSTTGRSDTRDVATTLEYTPTSSYLSRRQSSQVQTRSTAASRVGSRLTARRTSLLHTSPYSEHSSPNAAIYSAPSAPSRPLSTPSSRLITPSGLIWSRGMRGGVDGPGDEQNDSPVYRPVSRAMTEIGSGRNIPRFSARDRGSVPRDQSSPYTTSMQPEGFINSQHRRDTALPAAGGSMLHPRRPHGSSTGVEPSHSSVTSPATPTDGVQSRYQQGGAVGEIYTPWAPAENSPEESYLEERVRKRRSYGAASWIDSAVHSRLRAVKADREGRVGEPQPSPQSVAEREAAASTAD